MQGKGKYLILIGLLYFLEDIIVLNLLYFIIIYIFNYRFENIYEILLILINLGYILGFAIIRVDFSNVKQLHVPHLFRRNIYKLGVTALVLMTCLFFLKISATASRFFIGTFFLVACFSMTFFQWVTRKLLTFSIRQTISRGIILGAGVIGQKIFDEMLRNVYHGVVILGFFDDDPNKNRRDVLGNIEEAKEYILKYKVSYVFCTLPHLAEEKIKDFIKFCESHVINFNIVLSFGYHNPNVTPIVEHIGQMPVLVLRNLPLSYLHNIFIKRSIDVIFSLAAILLIFPILFPVLSLLIKLSSPGPVLFKQKRTGRRGREFYCYKFRTMRCSSDAHTKQATANDDRKTKVGNFLRKTSLDELPQLFNVLIGNMSLVGPRPHMLKHTDEYSPKVDKYMVRHFAKPGITGLAQVSGFRGETKDVELMEKRILEDIKYVENWTLKFDFKIMFKTIFVILKGDKNAY